MKRLSQCIARLAAIYQPAMVRVLRERHGKGFEPNKYASERIAVPAATAWHAAGAANTVAVYTKFMEVWPTLDWQAKKQIKQLSYPPHMRKLGSLTSVFPASRKSDLQ
jgi:hypothetical protein